MFRNEYQGGPVVEIFSAQGKDPVAKWKLCGGQTSISKVFDKEVKGFVYTLEGSSQTHKMQLPKDGRMPLVLIQRFLVLQINVPLGKDFSTELVITDKGHLKRRLYLSTVHKEFSATPLHARIPLSSLRRNVWCNLCIDLASFTAELFRGAAFLSLDGIVISACCKVRRIFTMRAEPADRVDRDLYDIRNGPKEDIPKSCQYPPDVHHITQLVNMETLRQIEVRSSSINSESEQEGTSRATTARAPKTQDSPCIGLWSKAAGRPPLTARKSSSSTTGAESRARTDTSISTLSGRSGNLQPRPPTDRASSDRAKSRRQQQLQSARREILMTRNNRDIAHVGLEGEDAAERISLGGSNMEHGDPLANNWVPGQSSFSEIPTPRHLQCRPLSASPPDLCVLETDDNSDTEPQLIVGEAQEEDEEQFFTFSSCPHSAKRNQTCSDRSVALTSDLKGRLQIEVERKEARLEDDFIGSEGEEDERHSPLQRFAAHSSLVVPIPPSVPVPKSSSSPRLCTEPAQDRASTGTPASSHSASVCSWRTEPACMAPTRCLSPSTARQRSRLECSGEAERSRPDGEMGTSISRTSVREIPSGDLRLHKVREGLRSKPVGSSRCDLHRRPEQGEEEEELRMLASLRREQEEEEGSLSSPGLSASQVDQCNVSLSMSSDDTSTWTQCVRLAAEQGQYYQNEMNPLLHSNPREWMDVLSPPIVHPRQQLTQSKGNYSKMLTKGSEVQENSREDEFLSLLYDPCLNCYFDPQTGKYYELI
ncbi:uncharacterized protein C3orf67 homolog isoform X2 [Hoplias malabaricus]